MITMWVKSSYSGYEGDCVELSSGHTEFRIRDSKHPQVSLMLPRVTWGAFLVGVRRGEFG